MESNKSESVQPPSPSSSSSLTASSSATSGSLDVVAKATSQSLSTPRPEIEIERATTPPPSITFTACDVSQSFGSSDGKANTSGVECTSNTMSDEKSAKSNVGTGVAVQNVRTCTATSASSTAQVSSITRGRSPNDYLQPNLDDNLRIRSNSEGNKFSKRGGNFTLSSIIRRSLFAGQEAISCPVTPQHPAESSGSANNSPQLTRAMLGQAKPVAKSLSNKMRGMLTKGKHQLAIARSYSLEGGKFIAKKKGGSTTDSQGKLASASVGPFFDEYRFLPLKWSISTFYDSSSSGLDYRQIYIKFFRFYRCYDLIPTSAKLVVFDTQLLVKKAFAGLVTHGVKAAPLWDSRNQQFVGMLTVTYFINILIDLHRQNINQPEELEEQKLENWQKFFVSSSLPNVASLKSVSSSSSSPASSSAARSSNTSGPNSTSGTSGALADTAMTAAVTTTRAAESDVDQLPNKTSSTAAGPPFISIDPDSSIFDAIQLLLINKIHRLPILDPLTNNVIYVITHKRILKFLFLYYSYLPSPNFLRFSICDLNIGTYRHIETLTPDTSLLHALNKFIERNISSLPIVDANGKLLDLFCKFDLFNLAANKMYSDLQINIRKALEQREDSKGEPLVTCSRKHTLHQVIESFVQTEAHRLVVVNEKDMVDGIISLSDMLRFFCSNQPIACLSQPEPTSNTPEVDCTDAKSITSSIDSPISVARARSPVSPSIDPSPDRSPIIGSSKKKAHKSFTKKSLKQTICSSKYRQNVIEETNEDNT